MKILYRGIFIATFKRTYIQDQARPIIVTSLLSYETSPYFSWREKSLLPKCFSQLEPCFGWGKTLPTIPFHEYICNLCFLVGWEKLGWPILCPPWQGKIATLCRRLSGGENFVHMVNGLGKNCCAYGNWGSANHTLSWICIKPKVAF